MRFFAMGLAAVAILCAACGTKDKKADGDNSLREPRVLVLFASTSLSESAHELAENFESMHPGVTVTVALDATNTLIKRLAAGESADLFAFVGKQELDAAVKSGLITADRERVFARNKIMLVVSKDNTANIRTIKDLGRPGLKVAVAGQDVPIGKFSMECLSYLDNDLSFGIGFRSRVLKNVVSQEGDVRTVLNKVMKKEADVGIVYISDLRGRDADSIIGIEIPDEYNVRAEYYIAPLLKSSQSDLNDAFIDLIFSNTGRTILMKRGFFLD